MKAARRVEPRDRGRPDAGIRAGGIGRAIDGSSSRSRTPSTQENSQRHSDDSPEESARKLSANISVPKHGRKSSLSATTVSSLTKKVLSSNRPTKLAGSLEDTLDKRKLAGKHNASADRNYNRAPMKSRKSSKATITTLSTKMLERSAFSDGMHDPPVSGKGNGDETYGPVELSTIANEGSLPPALTRSNEATSSTRLFLYDPWGFRYELVNDEDGTEVQPPDMSIETKKRICGVRRVSRRVLTWKELRADAASMQSDDNTYEPTSTVPDATKVTSEAVQRQASSKCRQTTANTLSRLRDTFYTYESLRKKAWEEYFTKYKAIPTEKGISKAEGLRVRDWMDFATSEKAYYAHYRTELYKGIPILLRPQLYKQCASAFDVMDETGYSRYRSTYLSGQVLAEDSRADIRLDSRRTFRQNLFFQEEGGYRRLEEVLGAFACAFPATGYCQGMNFVAAFLVLAMPTASDAFLLLIYLIRDVLPADYFSSGLQTAQADQRVLKVYVRTLLPALNEHLERHEIELGRVTLGWYLTLYTAYLPPEAAYRVWDVVFCRHQGSCALHEVALALLSLRQDELLSCGTDDEIYEILEGLCKDVDVEKLLQGCDGFRLAGLKPTSVQSLRSKAIRLTMSESRLQAERDRSRPMSLRSQDSDRKESRGEGGSSRDDGSLHDGSDVEPMMAR